MNSWIVNYISPRYAKKEQKTFSVIMWTSAQEEFGEKNNSLMFISCGTLIIEIF